MLITYKKNLTEKNMNNYDEGFWNAIDELVNNSEIIIDRPKGTAAQKKRRKQFMKPTIKHSS